VFGDLDEQRLVLAVDHGGHQFVATGEPAVDGGSADLGPAGHVIEGDAAETVPIELQQRRVDDRGGGIDRYGV